jgi:hypothetical protein
LTADISSGSYVPIVMGLLIGGAISAFVTWRAMSPTRVSHEPDFASPEDASRSRRDAMKRVASVYAPISFLCLAVAVVDGGATFPVLASINAGVGVVAVVLAWRFARAARDTDPSRSFLRCPAQQTRQNTQRRQVITSSAVLLT